MMCKYGPGRCVETFDSDELLVDLTRQDNVCAFCRLVVRHQDHLYRVALVITGEHSAAMKLSTIVLMEVWENRKALPGNIPFTYYIRHLAWKFNKRA